MYGLRSLRSWLWEWGQSSTSDPSMPVLERTQWPPVQGWTALSLDPWENEWRQAQEWKCHAGKGEKNGRIKTLCPWAQLGGKLFPGIFPKKRLIYLMISKCPWREWLIGSVSRIHSETLFMYQRLRGLPCTLSWTFCWWQCLTWWSTVFSCWLILLLLLAV